MRKHAHDPAPVQQDAASSPSSASPGALHGEAWLQVHTREAQRLVNGRPASHDKSAIVGLMGFAHLLRPIWNAARSGDPYGQWWLHKIQQRLMQAGTFLHEQHEDVTATLAQCPDLEIPLAVSIAPVRTPLRFGNPYAFQGARLIAQLDPLLRALLTAQHVALLSPNGTRQRVSACNRAVRRAYASAQGYHALEISVDDVMQGTDKALQARQVMGELPREFLQGAPLL